MVQHLRQLRDQCKLRFAIVDCELCAWIKHHVELRGVDMLALRHLNCVIAGYNSWANGCSEQCTGGRRYRGRFHVHRPGGPVETAMLAARDCVYELTLRVKNLDLEIAEDVA